MRIKIRKCGGFAGIEQDVAAVDTDELASARSDAVIRKVAQLERTLRQESAPVGSDMFRFEVEIEEAGNTRRFEIVDDENSDRADLRAVDDLVSSIEAG